MFYYKEGGSEFGPYIRSEFLALLKNGKINPATAVRTAAMQQWTNIEGLLNEGVFEKMEQARQEIAAEQEAAVRAFAHSKLPISYMPGEIGPVETKADVYASFLENEFALHRLPAACTLLPNTSAEHRAVFTWEAHFYNKEDIGKAILSQLARYSLGWLGHIFLREAEQSSINFQTAHDFSHVEALRQRRRWVFSRLLWWIAVALALGAFACGVYATAYGPMSQDKFFNAHDHAEFQTIFLYNLGGFLVMAVISALLFRLAKQMRLPRVLQNLEKAPLRVVKIEWLNLT